MNPNERLAAEHAELTRRYFLGLGALGAGALSAAPLLGREGALAPELAQAIARLEYLTPSADFTNYGRGKPPPHTLPPDKLREAGLTRETWRLEVVADPESDAIIDRPLTKADGTALDWRGLMQLAEKHAVRYFHVTTCTNNPRPCGMGLWEGVPLREILWLAQPRSNYRRVYYHGFHNDDPKQRFQSSMTASRALEDPPGEQPPMLCYKLNGQWLTPKRGGPVRMLAPGLYGNQSVKWLQRIVLTNNHQANDTYALWNNDVDSPLKTYARFLNAPKEFKAGAPAPLTGLAQVGMAGLSKVQYWLHPQGAPLPTDDPHFTKAPWHDAAILPPPKNWGGGLPAGPPPAVPRQLEPTSGRPRQWPLRDTLVHWAALLTDVGAGDYELRCRTIDANGAAQPLPRPYRKSGNNAIQSVRLTVKA